MTLRLHIERLVLDGLPLERRQSGEVQAAIETALADMLAARGIAPHLQADGAIDRLPAPGIEVSGQQPSQLGRQIAAAVHTTLAGPDAAASRSAAPSGRGQR